MPTLKAPQPATQANILTNQLHFELPTDWSALTQKYSIWRYRLNERQHFFGKNYTNKHFYGSFTNAYKNQIDRPFYYFTNDRPYAALYALLPHGQHAQPWQYTFGNPETTAPETIIGEPVAPDELPAHIMLKLMLALCFYENGPADQARRVCQSKFYLRVNGSASGKRLVAIEIQPTVNVAGDTVTLKVEANTFRRVEPQQVGNHANKTGAHYELFESQGYTYLRQLRPNQIATFSGPLYKEAPASNKRTTANWHHNGSKQQPEKYKETRSYLVRHVQERLVAFLGRYGFSVSLGEVPMHRLKAPATPLPLQRLPTIQVVDNRLNQSTVSVDSYLTWLASHKFRQGKPNSVPFTLPFELVAANKVAENRPLLVLIDADRPAFQQDNAPGLLARAGHQDPYRQLYQQLPTVVKQSLNVNMNELAGYEIADDYLNYQLPALAAEAEAAKPASAEEDDQIELESLEARKARIAANKQAKALAIKLDVCASELWLKWVLAGKADCAPATFCLPYFEDLSDAWGFLTNQCLLYKEAGTLRFADIATLEGKRLLRERFTSWSSLKRQFMARRPKYAHLTPADDWKADKDLCAAHFVLMGQASLEIERTEIIAMPNWPAIEAVRAIHSGQPTSGLKGLAALGVYTGGVWYSELAQCYIVSGYGSSKLSEARGHHVYQFHFNSSIDPAKLTTLLKLLAVTFIRRNQFTVWPYPFDLIRLHQELNGSGKMELTT